MKILVTQGSAMLKEIAKIVGLAFNYIEMENMGSN
jgi:hypothetical protein